VTQPVQPRPKAYWVTCPVCYRAWVRWDFVSDRCWVQFCAGKVRRLENQDAADAAYALGGVDAVRDMVWGGK
jgi:hypothetical protein